MEKLTHEWFSDFQKQAAPLAKAIYKGELEKHARTKLALRVQRQAGLVAASVGDVYDGKKDNDLPQHLGECFLWCVVAAAAIAEPFELPKYERGYNSDIGLTNSLFLLIGSWSRSYMHGFGGDPESFRYDLQQHLATVRIGGTLNILIDIAKSFQCDIVLCAQIALEIALDELKK